MQRVQVPLRYDGTHADQLGQALEIIPGRLFMCAMRTTDGMQRSNIALTSICYCIDAELVYEPFYADFGPLNLGLTYKFCQKTQELLQEGERQRKAVYFCCGPTVQQRANAAVLIGVFQVVHLGTSAEDAYQRVQPLQPFVPFRDASCGPPSFNLSVLHCIQGIGKAKQTGFIDWHLPNSTFSLEEYEHYEQVENGDLNWIVPGKLLAFSGPSNIARVYYGFKSFVPDDYCDYFRRRGVTAVVRLNKPMYDSKRFTDAGFRHHELYFPDGSCPPDPLAAKFLDIAEREPGALAIHCKAGLGRTGVLICSYMIKHYGFTPEEAIGYIRICRPGSVIGLQQNHLLAKAPQLQQAGHLFRQQHQMGGAPEVAPHLERMQPPTGPLARTQKPAAMAGALRKQNERPATARIEVTASSRAAGGPSPFSGPGGAHLQRAASASTRSASDAGYLYTPPSANTRSSTLRSSTSRLTNFLSATPSSLRASFGRSSLVSQSSPDPLSAIKAANMGRAQSQPPSPQLADMTRALAPGADPAALTGKAGVTRTLAPNGQPRKVPTALLPPGSTGKPVRLNSGGASMETSWKIGVNNGVNQAPAATTYGSAFGKLSSLKQSRS